VTYFGEVMRDAPLAYWRLGETSGTTAADASANGRHGAWSGAPALGQSGALNSDAAARAALLDGVDDHVDLPALPPLGDSLTIEFWFRPLAGGDAVQCIFGQADGSLAVLFKSTGVLSVYYAGADHLSGAPIAYDTWHHVAVAIDGGAGTFYVDGAAAGSFASFPSGFVPDRIGADAAGDRYKGYLAEVALYGAGLGAERVAAHYAAAWRGLLGLRPRLRRELRDEDAANLRWSDDDLDRHLRRAADELSAVWPEQRKTTLTTAPGSRDLSLAPLDNLVRVEAVEFPAGSWPPEFVGFQAWGQTLTLLVDARPSAAEDVVVYWARRHQLELLTSTLPPEAEETVLLGAGAFALLELAQYGVDRVSVGGAAAAEGYRRQGEARLREFRRGLRRFGDAARVRTARLFAPAGPAISRSTVAWG
jgi:hypothetical protein